jgi:predicted MPP superfamily phosphohydrolase
MLRLLLVLPLAVTALGVLVAGHWYLADRLFVTTGLPTAALYAGLTAISILGSCLVLQPIGERLLPRAIARWIAWPASLWLGLAFLLSVGLLTSELLMWAVSAAVAAPLAGSEEAAVDGARLRALAVSLVVLPAAVVALRSGLRRPGLRRIDIALPRWPEASDGFRIVQISDIHIGPVLGREFASWLVEQVNALDADLVAITGDLVDGSVKLLADEVAPFSGLRARHGVFFVTGNHDHYSGARDWSAVVAKLGITVLRNERRSLSLAGGEVEVAGVDDHRARLLPGESGEDLDRALAGVDPERCLLLLAHDPSTFKRASQLGVDLQLSGHTHGGQIWPFHHLVRLAIPFVAGSYRRGASQLYVSRGTGFWGPPMRLLAPAEITEIRLRRGSAVPAGA